MPKSKQLIHAQVPKAMNADSMRAYYVYVLRAMLLYRAMYTLHPSKILRRGDRLVSRHSAVPVPSVRIPIRIAIDLPTTVRPRGGVCEQAVAARVSVRRVAIRLAISIRVPVGGGRGGGVRVAVAVGVGIPVAVDDMCASAAGAHFQGRCAVRFARAGAFGVGGGEEVDEEGEHPEGEDEGDDPFEDGGLLGMPVVGEDAEDDGEAYCGFMLVMWYGRWF